VTVLKGRGYCFGGDAHAAWSGRGGPHLRNSPKSIVSVADVWARIVRRVCVSCDSTVGLLFGRGLCVVCAFLAIPPSGVGHRAVHQG